ncbi:MAG: hypothetical protein K940chlam3_01695, partial [Chlamydiae bacterium]|nr:hypothetical protein [Chlamydiota bacterium]
MRKWFTALLVFPLTLWSSDVAVETKLKKRQPHWLPNTLETYSNGVVKKIVFYDSDPDLHLDVPVKIVVYSPQGKMSYEGDLAFTKEQSQLHGASVWYGKRGKVIKLAFFSQGKIHGTVRTFYSNDQLKELLVYDMGIPHGRYAHYNEEGDLVAEGWYSHGKREGVFTTHFPDGTIASEIPYENGVPHGLARVRYPNGNEKWVKHFFRGVLHRDENLPAYTEFYPDYSYKKKEFFRFGRAHGAHESFHPNGQKKSLYTYVFGKLEGNQKVWNDAGDLIAQGVYRNGRPIGFHKQKYADGKTANIARYDKNGNLKEPIVEFDESGSKTAEYFLRNDKLHGTYREWFPNDQIKIDYTFVSGKQDGVQKEYNERGELILEFHMKNGKRHGLYQEKLANLNFDQGDYHGIQKRWYPNGQLQSEENYENGEKHGLCRAWYSNGNLAVEGHFVQGKEDGVHKLWGEEGTFIAESSYLNGEYHGRSSEWTDGSLKKKIHYQNGQIHGDEELFY